MVEINDNGDMVVELPDEETMLRMEQELANPPGVDSGPVSVFRILGVPMVGIPDGLEALGVTGRQLADYILEGAHELDALGAGEDEAR